MLSTEYLLSMYSDKLSLFLQENAFTTNQSHAHYMLLECVYDIPVKIKSEIYCQTKKYTYLNKQLSSKRVMNIQYNNQLIMSGVITKITSQENQPFKENVPVISVYVFYV